MKIPNWLWPSSPVAETSIIIRVARTIHYAGVMAAAVMLTMLVLHLGFYQAPPAAPPPNIFDQYQPPREEAPRHSHGEDLELLFLVLCSVFGGRAARYVLANE